MERWLPVVGREDTYEVSDMGNVRSRSTQKVLRTRDNGRGYPMVSLAPRPCLHRPIHRLVLDAFVGPRPPGHEARHLNGIRKDGRLANLCWGTHKENHEDRLRHGMVLRGASIGNAKLTEEQVTLILQDTRVQRRIAEEYGVSPSIICLIKAGKKWAHIQPERHAGQSAT